MITAVSVVVILIGVLLFYAATRPDDFRVERSIAINASPDRVFPSINDFHLWTGWSPWEEIDPELKRSYSGAASGRGTVYAWEGNNKVGKGRMEITESSSPSRVLIKLDVEKPFKANNMAEFVLDATGESTKVTWSMTGRSPFMMKVMGILMNMDRMVGGDFEKGLAKLKALAEK